MPLVGKQATMASSSGAIAKAWVDAVLALTFMTVLSAEVSS
jgi:hypothetical protein